METGPNSRKPGHVEKMQNVRRPNKMVKERNSGSIDVEEIDTYLIKNPELLEKVLKKIGDKQEGKSKGALAEIRSPSDTTIYTQAVGLKLSISEDDLIDKAQPKGNHLINAPSRIF